MRFRHKLYNYLNLIQGHFKMIKIANILLVLLLVSSCHTQRVCTKHYFSCNADDLTPVILGGKYGCVNKSGEWVLLPFAEHIFLFNNGYATIKNNGKYGIIDSQGNIKIPIKYDYINHIKTTTVAVVRKDNKRGLIEIKSGTFLTPLEYDNIFYLNEDLLHIKKDNLFGIMNLSGRIEVPCIYDDFERYPPAVRRFFVYLRNGKWGFLDNNFKESIPFIYDDVTNFSGSKALVKSGEWYFIDTDGNKCENLPIQPKEKPEFHRGLVFAEDIDRNEYLINSHGKILHVLSEVDRDDFRSTTDNLIRIKQSGKWGITDTLGNVIVPFYYENITYCSDRIILVKIDGKYGLIDRNAEYKEIVPIKYDWIIYHADDLFSVKIDGKHGLINSKNKFLIPPEYDNIGNSYEGMIKLKKDDKWGYADFRGRIRIKPVYDEVGMFYEGLSSFRTGKKWGFIDTKGKEVIKPEYDNVVFFRCGMAKVLVGDEEFYINKQGLICSDKVKVPGGVSMFGMINDSYSSD